jgi:hypothetical protein
MIKFITLSFTVDSLPRIWFNNNTRDRYRKLSIPSINLITSHLNKKRVYVSVFSLQGASTA